MVQGVLYKQTVQCIKDVKGLQSSGVPHVQDTQQQLGIARPLRYT